jgi:hypothetical protein
MPAKSAARLWEIGDIVKVLESWEATRDGNCCGRLCRAISAMLDSRCLNLDSYANGVARRAATMDFQTGKGSSLV